MSFVDGNSAGNGIIFTAAMKELEELDVEDMTLTSNTPLKKTSFQPTIVTVEPKKSAAEITPAAIEPSTSSQQKTPSTSTDFPSRHLVIFVLKVNLIYPETNSRTKIV